MATLQETPSIAELLKRKRDKAPKAEAYRRLGVAPNTYNTWESGMYVPGDEFADILADYLEIELPDVVWMLYRDRVKQAKGVSAISISRPGGEFDPIAFAEGYALMREDFAKAS